MDMLAEKLKLDPLEFRRRNSLKTGQTKATGCMVKEVWPFPELCDTLQPHYERAKQERSEHRSGNLRRGVGLGAAAFGIGSRATRPRLWRSSTPTTASRSMPRQLIRAKGTTRCSPSWRLRSGAAPRQGARRHPGHRPDPGQRPGLG